MAKRRVKKRTHLGAQNPKTAAAGHADMRDPKSMVIRIGAGEVGTSVSQLAADVRKVMEPGTASRLKERRSNRLKDYVVMAGPLGVTHMMLFSRSSSGNTNMRIAVTPRGPTMHFRVEKYSLCKDVQHAQRRPKGLGNDAVTPPLLVMNNFSAPGSDAKSPVPKHLESLATTVFQSIFPPINPQTTSLKSIRRVLLLNRELAPENDGSFVLNFRHFAITTRAAGISRPLKRLHTAEKLVAGGPRARAGSAATTGAKKGAIPNLGKLEDIADFMIGNDGAGYMTDATSGSEVDTDAEIEVLERTTKKLPSRRSRHAAGAGAEAGIGGGGGDGHHGDDEDGDEGVERRAVKLVELGPRILLRLTKVEEGLCAGKPLWHEYVQKSRAEEKELDERWETRRREKEARRQEQKQNLEKKRAAGKGQKGQGQGENVEGEGDSDEEMDDEYDYDYDNGYDSEGLGADGEMLLNEEADDKGEWEDEEEEIANG
ncbi:Brix-domain-containing protein [Sodiomyces alkalinus F11]|uniref:Brix-domain-containing protein n=1 Tax=Sodiomyces alkalinus (strain CBS 110278 / VKM F-3762 / F11) TaxID=1314773 RepID=A0A3N2Q3I3_SODAK|nr:Brix-domain-containing protein [Sodiomyces alkalinus F11]ROT41185.1 Brix-domain-containing protein [Sodiomyces alkalinus F11]